MKSPDEIKKGLEGPIPIHFHEGDREARLTPLALHGLDCLHSDTIALIQKLEEDKVRLECTITQLSGTIRHFREAEARVPRWISVEDRLPEKDQLVLFIPTCNSRSIYVGTLSHVGGRGSVMFEHRNAREKTKYYSRYWMPRPLPPSSPDGESTSLGDGG